MEPNTYMLYIIPYITFGSGIHILSCSCLLKYWPELILFVCLQLGEILEALVQEGSETMDVRNKDQVILRMNAPVSSKLYFREHILCPLIAEVHLFFFLSKSYP